MPQASLMLEDERAADAVRRNIVGLFQIGFINTRVLEYDKPVMATLNDKDFPNLLHQHLFRYSLLC